MDDKDSALLKQIHSREFVIYIGFFRVSSSCMSVFSGISCTMDSLLTKSCCLVQHVSHIFQHSTCKQHKAHAFFSPPDNQILLQSNVFCTALCRGIVSLYQYGARRYSSCFNSGPYVPFDPSQLTWCELNQSSSYILPAWAHFLLCLFVMLLFPSRNRAPFFTGNSQVGI